MAAGQGVAAPPAGPRWTAHPPELRASSWQRLFTHKAVQPENTKGHILLRQVLLMNFYYIQTDLLYLTGDLAPCLVNVLRIESAWAS